MEYRDRNLKIKFTIVADDNTGASDAAGMLTERGVKSLLILNKAYLHSDKLPRGYDAFILSTATRSSSPETAYKETAAAVKGFMELGAKKIQIKYSSTFDSTEQGNIGPSLDAALDTLRTDDSPTGVLQTRATVVSPALPVNGRTTYFGYHFVNGVLISESPLRHHPLNPITDPSLVRWLGKQTNRRVGLAPLHIIRKGPKKLSAFLNEQIESGISYIVTDTIDQQDLTVIAKATKDWKLISGGSGITAEIPKLIFGKTKSLDFSDKLKRISNRLIVAAGSCTPATIKQNQYALRSSNRFRGFKLDGKAVLLGNIDFAGEAKKILKNASEEASAPANIIVYTSSPPEEVEEVKKLGARLGMSAEETGEKIVEALAALVNEIMKREDFGKLCISGGETSGILCSYLRLGMLEVGLPIEPGVPYCFTTEREAGTERKRLVVLKSGNFGSEDFYEKVSNLRAE